MKKGATAIGRPRRLDEQGFDLPELLRCDLRALGHRMKFCPGDFRIDRGEARDGGETAIASSHHVFPSDHVGDVTDALRDQFRMLDEVVGRIDHARDQEFALGQLDVLEYRPFVLVARI